MKIDELASEALHLPVRERALLAASLRGSIEDPFDLAVQRSEEEAISLAFERDSEIESGQVEPLSPDELMASLRR